MSQGLSYQTLLAETIKDFVIHKKLGIEQIMVQVVESILQAEREVFLEDAQANKGNGFYSRYIKSFQGKLEIRVPRDRLGHFHPFMLEVIQQENSRLQELALSLYQKGVSHRGVCDIFESFFGNKISPSHLSDLVKHFEVHRLRWQERGLESHYHGLLIDALHQSIRRGSVEKEAIYVVMGLKADFTREILGIYQLPQESAAGWESVFEDLLKRGLKQVGFVLCDELSGIESAIEAKLPHQHLQLCLVHKVRNLLARVRHQDKASLASAWKEVLGLDDPLHTPEQFQKRLQIFIQQWSIKYPRFKNQLPEHKWRYLCAYLHYPQALRRMLYTTNWLERLNKEIRKVIRHVNSFPNSNAALNLVFMVTQQLQEKTYAKPITFFTPHKQALDLILYGQQTQKS